MIATLVLALGLVLCVEGLVFALVPLRMERVLESLRAISPEGRRLIGLAALAVGIVLIWLAKLAGA